MTNANQNVEQAPDDKTLHLRLVDLAVAAGDGTVTTEDLAAANGSLADVGYSSLSYMRLIDMIENELGVYLDPEADEAVFRSISSIALLVRESQDGAGG